jgi:hypothetical protein
MAAITLTKSESGPAGNLGGSKDGWESDPKTSWYTMGTVNAADTITFANWTAPLPRRIMVRSVITGENSNAEWALASGTLTVTLKGNLTTGAFIGFEL